MRQRSTKAEPRPGSVRSAMRSRDFRVIFVCSFSSQIGTWMQNVVLPAYVYDRTDSAATVAYLVFAQLGPQLLFSIPAGVMADKYDRRRWLFNMQYIQIACSLGLAPLAATDSPIWMLFMMQLGVGIGNALNAPAWSALLPSLVPKEDLPGAISLNSTVINGSRVIGPIIVALLSAVGVTTSEFFLINAATYLFVVFALAQITIPPVVHHNMEEGWRQFTSGIRIARARPALTRLLLTMCSFALISLPYVGLFPAVARNNFGIDESTSLYRWLYATWAFGAFAGGLSLGTIFVGYDKRKLIRAGFALFAIAMVSFAMSRSALPAFITGAVLGFAYFLTTTSMNTVLQSRLESAVRGRVMSLWFLAFGGTIPIGNLIFGPVIDQFGAQSMLLISAVWSLVLFWWCNLVKVDEKFPKGMELPEN